MSITTTITALQDLNAAITGVKLAPIAMPSTVNNADLPFVFVWPGEARHTLHATAWREVRRQYIVRCFVKPMGQGKGIDEGYQDAITMLQRFVEAYTSATAVNLSGAVAHITDIIDDGVGVIPYAGVQYHGFEMRVLATEKETL